MSEKTEADLDLLHLSPAKEELFAAVRLIKEHCKDTCLADCASNCHLRRWCGLTATAPETWPDPEGGGEDG